MTPHPSQVPASAARRRPIGASLRRPLLTLALAVCLPRGVLAQQAPAAPTLLPVGAGEFGRLGIDSASIERSGDSTFVFFSVAHLPAVAGVQGQQRRLDQVEMDCAAGRIRGWSSLLYQGDRAVELGGLSHEWRVFDEEHLATLWAVCGVLLRSFATALPREVHAGSTELPPRLVSPAALPLALRRNYPAQALQARTPGVAMLHFQVNEQGRVVPSSLRALWATPSFAEAALRVAATLRFDPARQGGHPVAVWLTVPFNFTPERPVAGYSSLTPL